MAESEVDSVDNFSSNDDNRLSCCIEDLKTVLHKASETCDDLISHKIHLTSVVPSESKGFSYSSRFSTGSVKKQNWSIELFDTNISGSNFNKCFVVRVFLISSTDPNVDVSIMVDDFKKPTKQSLSPGVIWITGIWKNILGLIEINVDFIVFEKIENRINKVDCLFSLDFDLVLCGDDWKLKAHKEILSDASPVFNAMFRTDMSENIENKIKINDFDCDEILAMLKYLYTNKIDNPHEISDRLFRLAHKYQIEDLKSTSLGHMTRNINTDNVIKFYELSQIYDLQQLNTLCSDFIQKNSKDIFGTEEKLANDFLENLAQNLNQLDVNKS